MVAAGEQHRTPQAQQCQTVAQPAAQREHPCKRQDQMAEHSDMQTGDRQHMIDTSVLHHLHRVIKSRAQSGGDGAEQIAGFGSQGMDQPVACFRPQSGCHSTDRVKRLVQQFDLFAGGTEQESALPGRGAVLRCIGIIVGHTGCAAETVPCFQFIGQCVPEREFNMLRTPGFGGYRAVCFIQISTFLLCDNAGHLCGLSIQRFEF